MSNVKAGYKGRVYLGTVKVGGIVTWTYSGETRNMQDIDEFGDEIIMQLPLQIVGGDIAINGHYLVDSDAGQKLLKTYFDAATLIGDIKLYTDYSNTVYMAPSAGSHVIVTNVNNVGDDKSGIGTFSATLHVNGDLEQVNDTSPSISASFSASLSASVSISSSLSASLSASISPSISPS